MPARRPHLQTAARSLAALAALATGGCALFSRPGPPPDAPTESALAAAAAPDVCKVTPSSLRRIGPLEAGRTTLGQLFDALGRPPGSGGERACWIAPGPERLALFAHGRVAELPVRSLAIAVPDPDAARGCGQPRSLPSPLALEAGLRPGMTLAAVVEVLGPVKVDDGGAFGKECCGLEQTGTGEQGPVYAFGCSAVLGSFKDGKLSSLLVSRYEPPGGGGAR